MADNKQEVTIHRSFAYTDKDGNQHYFTRANEHTAVDIMPTDHLKAYAESGLLSVGEAVPAAPAKPVPTALPAAERAVPAVSSPRAVKEA